MRFINIAKLACTLGAALILAAAAAAQGLASEANCQPIGGYISTNVNGFGPNTTMGTVAGDLAGAVGVEILSIATSQNGLVDVTVHHHWVTVTGETLAIDQAHAYGIYVAPGLLAVTNYQVHVSGGTGRYQNASGDLNVIGEADFNAGHLALRFTGHLCYGK